MPKTPRDIHQQTCDYCSNDAYSLFISVNPTKHEILCKECASKREIER